jgi:uncharacterized membrane protein
VKATIVTAAVAAGLIALAPAPATAQTSSGVASATVDIQVCNRSGRNATVAISYVEVGSGQFMNRGWYEVYNGACVDLVSTDNANFYMYGDTTDGSGRTWSGDHPLCVQYPGPYSFWSDGSETCPIGYEVKNFVPMHANEAGPYVWTLNP